MRGAFLSGRFYIDIPALKSITTLQGRIDTHPLLKISSGEMGISRAGSELQAEPEIKQVLPGRGNDWGTASY
jgi:hypothetical protein